MSSTIDAGSLLADMTQAMTDVLKKDVTLLRGYSRSKAQEIARFAKLIGEGYANGEIDEAQLKEELKELDLMVGRHVRNLQALANTTIERLIKAVTSTLYGAISVAAGAAGVPLPSFDDGGD
jgi:phosphoserine phosphatase